MLLSRQCAFLSPRSAIAFSIVAALTLAPSGSAQQQRSRAPAAQVDTTRKSEFSAETFSGLRARSIGPAMTSGRVMSIAVHPSNPGIIYVGTASGGLWKTTNGGASWSAIMDLSLIHI